MYIYIYVCVCLRVLTWLTLRLPTLDDGLQLGQMVNSCVLNDPEKLSEQWEISFLFVSTGGIGNGTVTFG